MTGVYVARNGLLHNCGPYCEHPGQNGVYQVEAEVKCYACKEQLALHYERMPARFSCIRHCNGECGR